MIIIIVPPYFFEMIGASTILLAYYVGPKAWVDARLAPHLAKHSSLMAVSRVISFVGDLLYASSLLFYPWMALTYFYNAPLSLMTEYSSDISNLLTFSSLLIVGSAAFLGLIVAAASVLSSRFGVTSPSLPRFFYLTKWMTRFSLACMTLAFVSLFVQKTIQFLFGDLRPFLLGLSSICFLVQVYLTVPAMRILGTSQIPEVPKVDASSRNLKLGIMRAVGVILLVSGLLLILGLL